VTTSPSITQRPATLDDAAVVAALLAEDETALNGHPSRLAAGDVASWWLGVDLEQDSYLLEEDGSLVALGWFDFHDPLGIHVGATAQGAKGRGLGGRVVDLGESRAAAVGAARVHTFALAPDRAAAELFLDRGYHEVRRFYDMAMELTGQLPEPVLPDGLTLEAFDPAGARAFADALNEAFEDHWEHHPTAFEEWWEMRSKAPDFDPTIWFLIRDGDEIAATIRNEPERNGGGYVGAIGVRRPWRGRGLAKALLLHSFREFQRRGKTRVTLGVDAQSPTGATKLYDRIGMHIEMEAIVFEKALA
jgi:mycothiol synthase